MADDSPVHLLAELSRAVDALSVAVRRPLTLIAESDLNQPRTVLPVEAGGLGMTAQWSDDFHHALHTLLTGEGQGYYADFAADPYAALARTLTGAFFHDGRTVDLPWCRLGRAGGPRGGAGLAVPGLPADARPGGQPGGRRPDRARRCRTVCCGSGPRWCSRRRSRRCSSWARSGARRRRGSSSPRTRRRRLPRPCATGRRRRVRRARVGGRGRARPAGGVDRRGVAAGLVGVRFRGNALVDAGVVPGTDRAPPGRAGAVGPAAGPGLRGLRRRRRSGWW